MVEKRLQHSELRLLQRLTPLVNVAPFELVAVRGSRPAMQPNHEWTILLQTASASDEFVARDRERTVSVLFRTAGSAEKWQFARAR